MRFLLLTLMFFFAATSLRAELAPPQSSGGGGAGGGRGGVFLEVHTAPVSNFDPSVSGVPVVVGGEGLGAISKNFRLGGGGGGGFLWGGSNTNFGMGYGGVMAEWAPSSWFYIRMLVGGGGFSLSAVTSQNNSTITEQKIAAGGFIVFFPSVGAEVPLGGGVRMGLRLGYFLPSTTNLSSLTCGLNLSFGR